MKLCCFLLALVCVTQAGEKSTEEVRLKAVSFDNVDPEVALQDLFEQASAISGEKSPTLAKIFEKSPLENEDGQRRRLKVTMTLKDVPLLVAVQYLCEISKWDCRVLGNVIVVSNISWRDREGRVVFLNTGTRIGGLEIRAETSAKEVSEELRRIDSALFSTLEISHLGGAGYLSTGKRDQVDAFYAIAVLSRHGIVPLGTPQK